MGIKVVVEVFGTLREKLGWRRKVVELKQGATLRSLVETLPDLREAVTQGGELREGVMIMVNGIHAQLLKGLETPLRNGDEVSVFPPGGGG
ncbi:MAG: molybdopterin synthase sulfur carrier subunit [Thermoprotei archaeon]|nr:MAG: molybdopterin synthase sulfur carrier subunit [Thermoprotei archaeon]